MIYIRLKKSRKMILSAMFLAVCCFAQVSSISKVLVPASWKEWAGVPINDLPLWLQANGSNPSFEFETFSYQKLDAKLPNYIAFNRGSEAGVYLRYIVDHYDNFPDMAIFTHAHPEHHHPYWLDLIRCIKPDIDYLTLNGHDVNCRSTHNW